MRAPEPALPASFGRYTLLERVGGGGMASVYRATLAGEVGFAKEVAVKVVRPELAEEPQFVEMFLDEARLSARLGHANVVHTFDFGQVDGVWFLAMEYVRGPTLAALQRICRARGLRLGAARSVHVAGAVARGLGHAHRLCDEGGVPLGLVHRDVSPQNVLVSREGEVKLADFGIAKAAWRSTVTRPGHVRGKCAYMAPEQARGLELDARTDVFALGIVLWECLAGRPLFDAASDGAVLVQVLQREIVPPSRFAPDVPPEVDALVLRLLARDPALRPANGDEVARELAELELRIVRSPADVDLAAFLRELGSGTAVLPAAPRGAAAGEPESLVVELGSGDVEIDGGALGDANAPTRWPAIAGGAGGTQAARPAAAAPTPVHRPIDRWAGAAAEDDSGGEAVHRADGGWRGADAEDESGRQAVHRADGGWRGADAEDESGRQAVHRADGGWRGADAPEDAGGFGVGRAGGGSRGDPARPGLPRRGHRAGGRARVAGAAVVAAALLLAGGAWWGARLAPATAAAAAGETAADAGRIADTGGSAGVAVPPGWGDGAAPPQGAGADTALPEGERSRPGPYPADERAAAAGRASPAAGGPPGGGDDRATPPPEAAGVREAARRAPGAEPGDDTSGGPVASAGIAGAAVAGSAFVAAPDGGATAPAERAGGSASDGARTDAADAPERPGAMAVRAPAPGGPAPIARQGEQANAGGDVVADRPGGRDAAGGGAGLAGRGGPAAPPQRAALLALALERTRGPAQAGAGTASVEGARAEASGLLTLSSRGPVRVTLDGSGVGTLGGRTPERIELRPGSHRIVFEALEGSYRCAVRVDMPARGRKALLVQPGGVIELAGAEQIPVPCAD